MIIVGLFLATSLTMNLYWVPVSNELVVVVTWPLIHACLSLEYSLKGCSVVAATFLLLIPF